MSQCNELLDFLLHLLTVGITASAGFFGAYAMYWFQARRDEIERKARYEALVEAIDQEAEVHGMELRRLSASIPELFVELRTDKAALSMPLQSFDTGSLESLRDELVYSDPRSRIGLPLRQAIRDLNGLQLFIELYRQSCILKPESREDLIRGLQALEASITTVKTALGNLKSSVEMSR